MDLSQLIPSRVRVVGRTLLNDLRTLRSTFNQPLQPISRTLHTAEEIDAFTHEAREVRASRLALDHAHPPPSTRPEAGHVRMRQLTVQEVHRPTADAITLVFANPPEDPILYHPGQFITLVVSPDGQQGKEEMRRAYSICSDPTASHTTIAVTVKRVAGGRVSNWLNDTAAPGDTFAILGPSGSFGTAPNSTLKRRVVLVGGGSGITPLFSVVQALLRSEPHSTVELIYANRAAHTVIFASELQALEAAYEGRFRQTSILEEPPTQDWPGFVGRLTGATLAEAIPVDTRAEYYICGPAPMMEGVTAYLERSGVKADRVHIERFVPANRAPAKSEGRVYPVRFARSGTLVQVRDDQTLLEAGRAAGVELDFSCT
ncbi:MAG: ferredoxin--NADP reductase, partial [Myxococcota bacterium]